MQEQYDKIYSYFRTTTEPFDELDWVGDELLVIFENQIIEKYEVEDLKELIENF